MRYLILSDLHANLEALAAVLEAAPRASFDRWLVLGDVVGYGASPNEVLERVQTLAPDVLIRGNHDKVAAGLEGTDSFNYVAAEAARWTYQALTPANRAALAALPSGPTLVDDLVEVCHGTPQDEDTYVFDKLDALRALETSARPVCFFGHTHVAVSFALFNDRLDVTLPDREESTIIPIHTNRKYLINPGSVGQPRDGDPRAAYSVFDSERKVVTLYRVPYPIELAQRKILAAGLPPSLAHRLALGK